MHVATTRRGLGGKTCCTHLSWYVYRKDGQVSHLSEPVIEWIRRAPRGETLANPAEEFEIVRSRAHGDRAAKPIG